MACSPVAIQGELKSGSSSHLLVVKDLVAGDCHHAATLPSQESSKQAHVGRHIYGITWLARRQIASSGRGMHQAPRTHHLPCAALLLGGFARGVLGLATAQAFTSCGAGTKILLVWLKGVERIHQRRQS